MGKKVAVGGVEGAPDTVYQASISVFVIALPPLLTDVFYRQITGKTK